MRLKMQNISTEGQIQYQKPKIGDEIYYTGDMANPSGFGRVVAIKAPNFYAPEKIVIEMEDKELFGDYAIKTVAAYCFQSGVGQRFKIKK